MIHKHYAFSALVKNPLLEQAFAATLSFTEEETRTFNIDEQHVKALKQFLKVLATDILDMKIVAGPVGAFVTDEGNVGPTAAVCISTSHLAIHIWSDDKPARVELDVYSCKEFNVGDVVKYLDEQMGIIKVTITKVERDNP